MDRLIVHSYGRDLLAKPSLHTHHHTSNRGQEFPHWCTKKNCLARTCCPWPECTGGGPVLDPPCARSSPSLVTLGSACFLTPTPESCHPPILYFLYPFPYSSLVWTSPAGALSTCNTFLSAAEPWSVPASSATFLPLLPWAGGDGPVF